MIEHGEERYEYDWFTDHIPVWTDILSPLAARPGLSFLEVGSFEGRSACWLLRNILTHESARLTCVDLFPASLGGDHPMMPRLSRPNEAFDRNIRCTGASSRVTKITGDSESVLRKLASLAYDFVYIDGGHQAANVLTDAVLSWRCLKVGGLLCFDDYLWAPRLPVPERPQLAVDAFMQVFAGLFETVWSGYQVFLRKTRSLDVQP